MKNLKDYIDSYNMICVRTPSGVLEGGDSSHNMWTLIYCMFRLKYPFEQIEPFLTSALHHTEFYDKATPTGIPIRHPDPLMWYSDKDRGSRDLLIPKIIGLNTAIENTPKRERQLIDALKAARFRLLQAHAKNFFLFTWNTRHNGSFSTWTKHVTNEYRFNPQFDQKDIRLRTIEVEENYTRYNFYRIPIPKTMDGKPIDNLPNNLEGTPITYERTWDYRWKMPDITGPEVWGLWIRAYPFTAISLLLASIALYGFFQNLLVLSLGIIIFLGNLENFLASIAKYFYNGGDDRNHFLITDFYNETMPFPLTRLSKWLYYKTSPIAERFRAYWERPLESAPLHTYMIDVLETWNKKKA